MTKTLSCFVDESGQEKRSRAIPKYYLLTVVLHDQDNAIDGNVAAYERFLTENGLDDIPFHAVDLLHGHKAYERLDPAARKKLLGAFASFVRKLPIRYRTFIFRRAEFAGTQALAFRMQRELTAFIHRHLEEFQSFDTVAVYDDGEASSTYIKMYGGHRLFRANFLKQARRISLLQN